MTNIVTENSPIKLHHCVVLPQWVDHNGHMNVAHYAAQFDVAFEAFLDFLNIGRRYGGERAHALFVVESHFTYQHEVVEGDPLSIRLQLLDRDRKRIHCFMELYNDRDNYLAATSEQIAVHVDLDTRKSLSLPAPIYDVLTGILDAHRRIARPKEVGHKIGIRRKKPAAVPA